jgi:SMI1 / KNR4 family (SUKH-1)
MRGCNEKFDFIQERMIYGGLCSTGCSDDEIKALEMQYDLQFPAIYRIFLTHMGHYARDFLVGTDWKYPRLKDLRGYAESLIAESNTSYRLPKNAFVFVMHQGYSFLFFHATSDDPPVWLYEECDEQPKLVSPSFSAWLVGTVEEHIQRAM